MAILTKPVSIVIACSLIIVSVSALALIMLYPGNEDETVNETIDITGNSELRTSKWVTRGNGTVSNPYVISGFDMLLEKRANELTGYAMTITSVDAHTVIRDMTFRGNPEDASWAYELIGVGIWDVSNVTVERCTFENLTKAAVIVRSTVDLQNNSVKSCTVGVEFEEFGYDLDAQASISFNSFHSVEEGIYFKPTRESRWTDVHILNNSMSHFAYGILMPEGGYQFTIAGNQFYYGSGSAIDAFELTYSEILKNRVDYSSGYGGGFDLSTSANDTIEDNWLSVDGAAIALQFCNDVLVTNNFITGSGTGTGPTQSGIVVENSFSVNITYNDIWEMNVGVNLISSGPGNSTVWVHHNRFVANFIQALDNSGSENHWDDGVGAGNSWTSNHGAPGNYEGIDSDHDGIGDTPYDIDADSIDHYPLMTWSDS